MFRDTYTGNFEFIPSPCLKQNLHCLLPANVWDYIRRFIYKLDHNRCVLCSKVFDVYPSTKVECHEVWEYDDINHVQTLNHCVSLCEDCHKSKHLNQWVYKYMDEELLKDYIDHYCMLNGHYYYLDRDGNRVDSRISYDSEGCISFTGEIKSDIDKGCKDFIEALQLYKERSNYKWTTDFGVYSDFMTSRNIYSVGKAIKVYESRF